MRARDESPVPDTMGARQRRATSAPRGFGTKRNFFNSANGPAEPRGALRPRFGLASLHTNTQ